MMNDESGFGQFLHLRQGFWEGFLEITGVLAHGVQFGDQVGAAVGGNPWPDMALCPLTGAAYAVIGVLLARRLVDSARERATLALN